MGLNFFKKKKSGVLNIPPPPPPPEHHKEKESKVLVEDKLANFNPVMAPPIIQEERKLPDMAKAPELQSLNLEELPKSLDHPPRVDRDFAEIPGSAHHDEEIKEVKKGLDKTYDPNKPCYVNMEHYMRILNDIDEIHGQMKALGLATEKIDNLSKKEDVEYRNWYSKLEDIRKKLLFVDEVLFEG